MTSHPAPPATGVELTLLTCGGPGRPAVGEPLVNEPAPSYVE